MPMPNDQIPPEVLAALRRGSLVEAIKLLRNSGIGLKEAKELLEAQRRRDASPAVLQAGQAPLGPPRADAAFPSASMVSPPAAAVEALRRGNKIEAITLMRAHAGIGLKEAKDAIDAMERTMGPRSKGLSPGEVPHSSEWRWWIVAIIAGLVAYYLLVRFV